MVAIGSGMAERRDARYKPSKHPISRTGVLAGMESSRSRVADKSGRAVAFAIVPYIPQAPLLLRQAGLGAKRKTRIGWPIDVEADDIPQLVGEQGTVGELESLDATRRSLYAPSSGGTEPGEMPSPMPRTVH